MRWLRAILYFHLTAIVFCAVLTLVDTGRLHVPDWIGWAIALSAVPMLMASVACPLAMVIGAVFVKSRSVMFRMLAVAGDAALSVFQLWVLQAAC